MMEYVELIAKFNDKPLSQIPIGIVAFLHLSPSSFTFTFHLSSFLHPSLHPSSFIIFHPSPSSSTLIFHPSPFTFYPLILSLKFSLVIVGNKIDLVEERQVSFQEGETFAKQHDILFFEISVKNNLNVEESFNSLIRLMKEQKQRDTVMIKRGD